MAKMLVTDRDSQVHEVEGQLGLKFMETLRGKATRRSYWSSSSTTIRPGRV